MTLRSRRAKRAGFSGPLRRTAWCAAFALLWATAAVADAPNADAPIVTNIAGSLIVRDLKGRSHDVGAYEPLESGETVSTGTESLASIALAGVGRFRLGPSSSAQIFVGDNQLSLRLSSGSSCATAEDGQLSIVLGGVTVTTAGASTIFDVIAGQGGATLAVYRGSVTAGDPKAPGSVKAGEALFVPQTGAPKTLSIADLSGQFAPLRCPEPEIIAQAASPSPSPGPGHSGGGGGALGILAGLGVLAAAAGHGGGGGGGSTPVPAPTPAPSPSPTPGALTVSLLSLSFVKGGSPAAFSALEANYRGPLNATTSNAAVAMVAPPSANGPFASFTVSPGGAGNATITISDNHGGKQTVSVSVTGPLTANPTTLQFLGTTATQTFTASDPNYAGTISASTSNASVATVTPSGTGPSAPFVVTPVAQGNATITLSDTAGASAAVTISVSTGGLQVNPPSLTIAVGRTAPLTAIETNYTGPITASSENSSVAKIVGPASGNGPTPAPFTISGTGSGTTNIDVEDQLTPQSIVRVPITVTGPLSVSPGSLTFNGTTAPQTFTASDPNNPGTIAATSSNINVATVSPGSGSGAGPITFTVAPAAAGSATITVTDLQGSTKTVSVSVTAGALALSASSLTFASTGAPAQTFTASETNYNGAFSVSGCPGVAGVSPNPGSGPSQLFTVSPLAPGSCTLTVADDHGGSKTVAVTIYGPLTVSASSLSFAGAGAPNQTFTASESFFSGTISASSANTAIATVSPASGSGPGPITFTVAAAGTGSTTITVIDGHGGTQSVSVSVAAPGALGVSPTSLTFASTGAPAQTFTASETNYNGAFSVSGCPGVAGVSPNPGSGPSQLFTVSPLAPGSCTLTVADDHGGGKTVAVTIYGPLTVSASSLSFAGAGAPNQTFTASESFFSGTISASSANTAIATVSPASGSGPGPITFTVAAAGTGSTTITVIDGHGGTQSVSVSVAAPGALGVSPTSLTFASTGAPAQTFTASETNYNGAFSVSGCPGVAGVSPNPGSGPSQLFTVSPLAPGSCTLTVADDHGGSKTVAVTIYGPLTVSASSLSFAGAGAPNQTFTASESFFSGTISASSANTAIATVSPASGSGPGPITFTVAAAGTGSTTITVIDGHGGTQSVSVSVAAPGALGVSPTSLTFASTGAPAQTFTASETNYNGAFSVSGCPGVAGVSPNPGSGPSQLFTVSPLAPGSCTLTVADDHGGGKTVAVTIYGPLIVSASSLALIASGATGSFTASETGYSGQISAVSSNGTIASVSPGSAAGPGPVTFTVTPGSSAGNAKITVSDDHGGAQTIIVSVTTGSLTVNPVTLQVASGGTATFTATDPSGTTFSAISSNSTIATVAPASQPGPSPVTFTVTGVASGATSITVTDTGGTAVVSVGVGQSPLGTYRRTIQGPRKVLGPVPTATPAPTPSPLHSPALPPERPHKPIGSQPWAPTAPPGANQPLVVSAPSLIFAGTTLSQTIGVTEGGYSGAFTATSSNAGVAAVVQPSGAGPAFSFTVLPKSTGVATIRITDDHGSVQIVIVTVSAPARRIPLPSGPGPIPLPPGPGK